MNWNPGLFDKSRLSRSDVTLYNEKPAQTENKHIKLIKKIEAVVQVAKTEQANQEALRIARNTCDEKLREQVLIKRPLVALLIRSAAKSVAEYISITGLVPNVTVNTINQATSAPVKPVWLLGVHESYDEENVTIWKFGTEQYMPNKIVNYRRRAIGLTQDGTILDLRLNNSSRMKDDEDWTKLTVISEALPAGDETLVPLKSVRPESEPSEQPIVMVWNAQLQALGEAMLTGIRYEPMTATNERLF